jgi:HK97 family phage major capsid protein
MVMMTTTGNVSGITPNQYGDLILLPLQRTSAAMLASDVWNTEATNVVVPILTADPEASWVAEGNDIDTTDAAMDSATYTPKKLAALSIAPRRLGLA